MALAKNVPRGEGIMRVILGVIIVVGGFSVSGFWKPVLFVAGAFLFVTAFVGY